jgi:hypothetical protein
VNSFPWLNFHILTVLVIGYAVVSFLYNDMGAEVSMNKFTNSILNHVVKIVFLVKELRYKTNGDRGEQV